MARILVATLGMLLALFPEPATARAEGTSAGWTVDKLVLAEQADDFQIAPDGRHVVWVKSVFDEDEGERVTNLMRTELPGGPTIELTRGKQSCSHPRWSPDGKYVAFLSARPDPADKSEDSDDDPADQVWVIPAFGGEGWRLTKGKRRVQDLAWSDRETLLFLAQEEPTFEETRRTDERKDTTILVEDQEREPPVRLYRVTVPDGKVQRLTDNADRIQSMSVSPDGKLAVLIHQRSLRYDYDNRVKPEAFLFDVTRGTRRRIFADPKHNLAGMSWSPDGRNVFVVSSFTTHPQYVHAIVNRLYHLDVGTMRESEVTTNWPRGLADSAELSACDDGCIVLLADGVRVKAARFTRDGDTWRRTWISGEHASHLYRIVLSRDGKQLVYAHSTASKPEQWYHAHLRESCLAESRPLTALNPSWDDLPKARTEVVRWSGARGEEVEGILYYPHDHEAGRRYPLVLMIHGGPAGVDLDRWEEDWSYAPNLYTRRGAFVLKPNYHGSTQYGQNFVESIAGGKYYEYPLEDLEKGIAALAGRGLIDVARVGTLGWSNGAILSMALVTRNPNIKAVAAGAGGAEWVSDWGACEMGLSFSNYYFGKSPLDDPQLYLRIAPLYQYDRIRTPTLLFQGAEDRIVPVHHGWLQYRTLQHLGKAPVRFLLMPGEEHSLSRLAHQRRKLNEELAWFDRYLFGSTKDRPEFLKEDSPLAAALHLRAAARDGGRLGRKVKELLVPETVEFEGLEIGRFEITRAQFAQFDPRYSVPPGTENMPATAVSFEQARAYCTWLSKMLGETYRLPDTEEAESLYGDTGAGENTLDRWAGYPVNPEDAKRLGELIARLEGEAPLLRPVGSFPGRGEHSMVFDLGGNAAEWMEVGDNKGEPRGGCAALPVDARSRLQHAPAAYTGFRVVKSGKP